MVVSINAMECLVGKVGAEGDILSVFSGMIYLMSKNINE